MQSRKLTRAILIIYLIGLIWIILFKFQFTLEGIRSFNMRNVNLVPFAGTGDSDELINNVLIFVPYGLLSCMLWRDRNFFLKLAPIFFTSLVFEVLQYVFWIGISDITDLLGNTLGGLIGMTLFYIFSFILKDKVYKALNVISLIAALFILIFITILTLTNL